MNIKDFLEKDTSKRVIMVNQLLKKYQENSLKNVAKELGINYSTFCKEMSKDNYVYIKRDNKYYRFIKDTEDIPAKNSDFAVELSFIKDNLSKLETLLSSTYFQFQLDKRVYTSDVLVNKNIKVNEEIYNDFIILCQEKFPYLKIQDIISQCLLTFTNSYKNK